MYKDLHFKSSIQKFALFLVNYTTREKGHAKGFQSSEEEYKGTCVGRKLAFFCLFLTWQHIVQKSLQKKLWGEVASLGTKCMGCPTSNDHAFIQSNHPMLVSTSVDVIKLCDNMVSKHRSRFYGGWLTIWDFMVDVNKNINNSKKYFGFTSNNKAFVQAMKIYGGRQMRDLFTWTWQALAIEIL